MNEEIISESSTVNSNNNNTGKRQGSDKIDPKKIVTILIERVKELEVEVRAMKEKFPAIKFSSWVRIYFKIFD